MSGSEPKLGDFFNSRREKGVEGLPTLSVTLDRGLIPRGSLERRTETELAAAEHLLVRSGDIAYNMMRMWQGASGLANQDAIVSPAYIVLEPKKNLDPRYAAYLFKLPRMVHRFWSYSYGLTEDRLRLYWNDFKRIPWDVPPLPEQKKIVEILSTWDAAIETTEKLLANAEQQKCALMQQLLTGKRRLRGFEGRVWDQAELGDLLDIEYGKSPRDVSEEKGEFPIIGTGGVTGRTNEWLVEGPAIVIGRKGTIDSPMFLEGRFWPIDTTFYCQAKSTASLKWLFYLLQRMDLGQFNEASGVPSLSRETLRAIPVAVPSLKEQEQIGDLLSRKDARSGQIRRQAALLRREKSALMQQLLTGKRRVTV